MVIVSDLNNTVMVMLNVLMDPMKEINNAASTIFHSTTIKNVAVLNLNSNVLMVTVSVLLLTAMALLLALMDLMKVMISVASKTLASTTIKDVDASRLNGHVLMVTVSICLTTVMVKLNVLMDLMKVKRSAASRDTLATTARSVAATQTLNGLVPTVTVSK